MIKLFGKCFAVTEAVLVCLPWVMWLAALRIDWGIPKGRILIKFSPYFLPPAVLARDSFHPVKGVLMPHGLAGWLAVSITYTVVASIVALFIAGIVHIVKQTGAQNTNLNPISGSSHELPEKG